jgi:hypothetical protein
MANPFKRAELHKGKCFSSSSKINAAPEGSRRTIRCEGPADQRPVSSCSGSLVEGPADARIGWFHHSGKTITAAKYSRSFVTLKSGTRSALDGF